MSRALVLGGGGPVGIAWQAGLAVGLAGAGIDLDSADYVVGTSAGSNVGARLTRGDDLSAIVDVAALRRVNEHTDEGSGESAMAGRLEALLTARMEAAALEDEEAALAHIGSFSLSAEVGPEERFLALFDNFADTPWPERFACTAIDAISGEFVVWDGAAGVPLQAAVASSCSVPGIFPPITIEGRRYYDGGLRTPTNADLAAGHDAVVVVSCMSRDLPGSTLVAEVEALRSGGAAVELVEPDTRFLELSGHGMYLMDPGRAPDAYEAGRELGARDAERLGQIWS